MKRAADSGDPGTSSADSGHDESPIDDGNFLDSQQSNNDSGEPVAKKPNLEVKQEINEGTVEQSGALVPDEHRLPPNTKRESEEEEDEEEGASRSPIAAMDDEEEDDDDADSFIAKADIPSPSHPFMKCCAQANLLDDVVIGAWEMYYHASQRVSLEGSEKAWQMSAVYYYFLSKGVKRRGKAVRHLVQPFPVSILKVIEAFDVTVMEVLDKVVRFVEIIHSRKMRRYIDYLRRLQEGLAVSCVIFKKYVKVYPKMFVDCKQAGRGCPSSYELFNIIWTSYLILKSRLPNDDLITNYQLLFSILDDFYTTMCSMKDGIVFHLNQEFVAELIQSDSTIIRALCNRFGGSVLDARHFYDHTYKKLDKTGLPSIWDFIKFRESILTVPAATYEKFLLDRGCVDERIFVPNAHRFSEIFKPNYADGSAKVLTVTRSGEEFKDAAFLNQLANKQCIEKLSLSQQKGSDRLAQAKEQPRVPCVEFDLSLAQYPEDQDSNETHQRLRRIIGGWELEFSKLKQLCEQMSDNPMATFLLKRDVLSQKFESKLDAEVGDSKPGVPYNRYHQQIRKELEKLFLIFVEKIIVVEMKKEVREDDLLNVIRREDLLDSIFCFCVELALFSNSYARAFPWSAELCDCHPFQFHKVIDLMINHEKRLSRPMVQHFNRIEESVIEYHAWKSDSPLWPMIVRCPFTHFHEFGEDWADKLSTYSPMKFTPIRKSGDMRDELGRPIVPQNQTSRTIRIFLKRTFFTAARRLQELTDRISMSSRPKSQCWSLFDYLVRNDPLILMDRHLDQIILCCVYVVMKVNDSNITFNEIMAQYRRQSKDASFVYRNVTVFSDQLSEEKPVNTRETVVERLEAPLREKVTVNLIKYYNLEFRDRIKYIIGQLDSASDEDLMEMPVPTSYGLLPVKVYLSENLSIQMLPKTTHGTSKQELVIANLEKNGVTLDANPGTVSVPPAS